MSEWMKCSKMRWGGKITRGLCYSLKFLEHSYHFSQKFCLKFALLLHLRKGKGIREVYYCWSEGLRYSSFPEDSGKNVAFSRVTALRHISSPRLDRVLSSSQLQEKHDVVVVAESLKASKIVSLPRDRQPGEFQNDDLLGEGGSPMPGKKADGAGRWGGDEQSSRCFVTTQLSGAACTEPGTPTLQGKVVLSATFPPRRFLPTPPSHLRLSLSLWFPLIPAGGSPESNYVSRGSAIHRSDGEEGAGV